MMVKPFKRLAKVYFAFDVNSEILTVLTSDELVTVVETYDGQIIDDETRKFTLAQIPSAI